MFGLIVPGIDNRSYSQTIQAMHDASRQHNFSILLLCSFGDPEKELEALKTLQAYRADAIILNSAEAPMLRDSADICEGLIQQGCPVILTGDPKVDLLADRVIIRNKSGTSRATRHLIKKGHEKIGFIGGSFKSQAVKERFDGYQSALSRAGLTCSNELISLGDQLIDSVFSRVFEAFSILPKKRRPTAVVCANDMVAIGVMKAFNELKLRIPEDVAIVGFDDTDIASFIQPTLTTMQLPHQAIARDCADLIVRRLSGEKINRGQKLVYEAKLIERDSS